MEEQESFQDLSVEGQFVSFLKQFDSVWILIDERYSIWISFFELYNENILDLLVQPKQMKTRKNLRLMQNDHSTIIKNLIQIPVFDQREAEDIIRFGFANRSTSKTNLNDASSRSHAVLCITLITTNEFDEQPTMSHMCTSILVVVLSLHSPHHLDICDLAGNEPSAGAGKQLIETCNINTSLMTFKDCVRILNENQTAKWVEVSERRRMIKILIEIENPCWFRIATVCWPVSFVHSLSVVVERFSVVTSTLVQHSSPKRMIYWSSVLWLRRFACSPIDVEEPFVAFQTIIVPNERKPSALIRPQRKSKNKGPKRLARDGTLKAKNISHPEETEDSPSCCFSFPGIESDMTHSLSKSSLMIPTDIKSVSVSFSWHVSFITDGSSDRLLEVLCE